MAKVFTRVQEGTGRGKKLTKIVAMHEDVQARLQLEAELGAFRADANLAIVRAKPGYDISGGHSFIEVDTGTVDRYVVLNDERGLSAAMTIEYGRKAADRLNVEGAIIGDPGMAGLFILHDAMHLSRGEGASPQLLSSVTETDGEEQ